MIRRGSWLLSRKAPREGLRCYQSLLSFGFLRVLGQSYRRQGYYPQVGRYNKHLLFMPASGDLDYYMDYTHVGRCFCHVQLEFVSLPEAGFACLFPSLVLWHPAFGAQVQTDGRLRL